MLTTGSGKDRVARLFAKTAASAAPAASARLDTSTNDEAKSLDGTAQLV